MPPVREKKVNPKRQRETLLAALGAIILLLLATLTSNLAIQSWTNFQNEWENSGRIIQLNRIIQEQLENIETEKEKPAINEIINNLTKFNNKRKERAQKKDISPERKTVLSPESQKILNNWRKRKETPQPTEIDQIQEELLILENCEKDFLLRTEEKTRKQTRVSYNTTKASIIAALAMIYLTITGIARETHTARQQKQLLEEKVQERTQELQKANKVKSDFLAIMSHEIRTPLNSITNWCENLQENNPTADQTKGLNEIRTAAKILENTLHSILNFAHNDAGKIKNNYSPILITDLFEKVIKSYEIPPKQKIQILQNIPEENKKEIFWGDEPKIFQILSNLFTNAIKFTNEGEVTLSFSSTPKEIIFQIDDTGTGIPEEFQETIFDPFIQVNSSTTRSHGGTGIGLAVCKKLAQRLEGTLQIIPKPPPGSKFELRIPIHTPPINSATHQEFPKNPKILLVEDNLSNRNIVKLLLKRLGLPNCHEATNGQEATDMVSETIYDFILMDVEMPIMDGIQATQKIRKLELKHPTRKKAIIVAITAHALDEILEQCITAGMNDTLIKPLNIQRLKESLKMPN